jgi:hypothetical protein
VPLAVHAQTRKGKAVARYEGKDKDKYKYKTMEHVQGYLIQAIAGLDQGVYTVLRSHSLTAWLWLSEMQARPKAVRSHQFGLAQPSLFRLGPAWLAA